MSEPIIKIKGNELLLLPDRAAFMPVEKILILSDLHLGKINHFRKAGIAVPTAANHANTELLIKLIMVHKPTRVIFIGDLFHSTYNAEWEVLGQVIKNFSHCSFELVPGNHDIMSEVQYQKHNIILHPTQLEVTSKLILVHEPIEEPKKDFYYLSGHIHPAISLYGKARQSLRFPCFWFGKQQGYLPAFGVFTGFKSVKPEPGDQVFGIVEGKIIPIELPTA